MIRPKVEPEIAFELGRGHRRPGCHIGHVLAVSGDPAVAVAMLANHLDRRARATPPGTLVLSGGVSEAVAVTLADHVQLRAQDRGNVSLRFA